MENVVRRLLSEASHMLINCRSKQLEAREKLPNDWVSSVDIEVGTHIVETISKVFPSHAIVCEDVREDTAGKADVIWLIDPLDGTTNYLHGFPDYAVAISAFDRANSAFLVSGVRAPFLGLEFIAVGDQLATLNGERLAVSSCSTLSGSLLLTGFTKKLDADGKELRRFARASACGHGTRRTGSAAIDLCYVAAGFAEAYFHHRLSAWDIAAGRHMVLAAGGVVTNLSHAMTFDEGDTSILASNGRIHKQLLDYLLLEGN